MKGPRSKSYWAKTKIDQDKGHIEVRIDQYQGHIGADIKVILGAQDEGQYGFGQPSWVKMKAMLGSVLANIRVMLGPTSKLYWAKTKVNIILGNHFGTR